MTGYEFEQHALDLRAALETVFMTITFGDMLGLPVIPPIYSKYIVPTHCTGFEAISAFAHEMPEQFILNTAGTRYTIAA